MEKIRQSLHERPELVNLNAMPSETTWSWLKSSKILIMNDQIHKINFILTIDRHLLLYRILVKFALFKYHFNILPK